MISDATKAVVGTTCLRTDVGALPGTLYVLQALPNNVLGNWQPASIGDIITSYTAAQLAALAAAGGLTPFATYVPSNANPPYQLWARSASEFGSPIGGDFSQTSVVTADGNTATLVKPAGMSRCAVSVTGSVDYAAIYVEDADTGAIYGAFGAPMTGTRWCALPAGEFNLRGRVAGFSGTSMTLTLAGGV